MSPRRWALVASLFALGPLGAGCGGEEPPTLAEVPAFELVDQSGAPFRTIRAYALPPPLASRLNVSAGNAARTAELKFCYDFASSAFV